MYKQDLFGIWKLEKLCDISSEGMAVMRDHRIEGRLIYSQGATVSVMLAYHKPTGYSSNFYTGHFTLSEDGSEIYHHVEFSSDERRNGKTLTRAIFHQNGKLLLKGKNHLDVSVELVWERDSRP